MKIWTLVSYDVIHRTSSVNRKALISVQTSALINPHHGRKKNINLFPRGPCSHKDTSVLIYRINKYVNMLISRSELCQHPVAGVSPGQREASCITAALRPRSECSKCGGSYYVNSLLSITQVVYDFFIWKHFLKIWLIVK